MGSLGHANRLLLHARDRGLGFDVATAGSQKGQGRDVHLLEAASDRRRVVVLLCGTHLES